MTPPLYQHICLFVLFVVPAVNPYTAPNNSASPAKIEAITVEKIARYNIQMRLLSILLA